MRHVFADGPVGGAPRRRPPGEPGNEARWPGTLRPPRLHLWGGLKARGFCDRIPQDTRHAKPCSANLAYEDAPNTQGYSATRGRCPTRPAAVSAQRHPGCCRRVNPQTLGISELKQGSEKPQVLGRVKHQTLGSSGVMQSSEKPNLQRAHPLRDTQHGGVLSTAKPQAPTRPNSNARHFGGEAELRET